MSTYSRYRQRIGDTVNNGVAWKTPSCICSCQWCFKSEVLCGNCWMLRRRLEAATGCQWGPQYDGKCSFYLICYFFRTSLTNRDLREKADYFPPRSCRWPRFWGTFATLVGLAKLKHPPAFSQPCGLPMAVYRIGYVWYISCPMPMVKPLSG